MIPIASLGLVLLLLYGPLVLHGSLAPGSSHAIAHLLFSWLPVLALGLLAGGAVGGRRGLAASAKFLAWRRSDVEPALVQGTLAGAARGLVRAGWTLSLLAGTCVFLLVGQFLTTPQSASPAELAQTLGWTLLPGIVAVAVGRGLLGPAADAAAVRGGNPRQRCFSSGDDLGLLLFVLPPTASMFTLFIKHQPL